MTFYMLNNMYSRKKPRSTYMALLSLVDNLTHALENREYS